MNELITLYGVPVLWFVYELSSRPPSNCAECFFLPKKYGPSFTGLENMEPSFVRMLASESVHTVLITGCGGGFDFVHGALLLPLLKANGKHVVFVSFSFGSPGISGN